MSKNRMFSIITIACFVSVIFIPIGLVTMWYFTNWKKKLKLILSAALTAFYAGIVALLLLVEPSYNTSGVSLPFSVNAGQTAFETTGSGKLKKADDIDGDSTRKTDKKDEAQPEEKLPGGVKKQQGQGNGRALYAVMLFFFMLLLVI